MSSLTGWVIGVETRSTSVASFLRVRGIPPNRATSGGLRSRSVRVRSRSVVRVGFPRPLCACPTFDTVDLCLAANVLSIGVFSLDPQNGRMSDLGLN